jgi:hypothetical protein
VLIILACKKARKKPNEFCDANLILKSQISFKKSQFGNPAKVTKLKW